MFYFSVRSSDDFMTAALLKLPERSFDDLTVKHNKHVSSSVIGHQIKDSVTVYFLNVTAF